MTQREEAIEDLRDVSQQVIADTDIIRELERRKRHLDPSSVEFRKLSTEIEQLAKEVGRAAAAETALAEDVADEPGLPTVAEADRWASGASD
jgi:hypothetical protein